MYTLHSVVPCTSFPLSEAKNIANNLENCHDSPQPDLALSGPNSSLYKLFRKSLWDFHFWNPDHVTAMTSPLSSIQDAHYSQVLSLYIQIITMREKRKIPILYFISRLSFLNSYKLSQCISHLKTIEQSYMHYTCCYTSFCSTLDMSTMLLMLIKT